MCLPGTCPVIKLKTITIIMITLKIYFLLLLHLYISSNDHTIRKRKPSDQLEIRSSPHCPLVITTSHGIHFPQPPESGQGSSVDEEFVISGVING